MAQLTWITPAGNIGSYAEGAPVVFTFQATPSNMSNTLTYVILNGTLPDPTSTLTTFALNSSTGVLTGTAAQVESNTIHTFTIRVSEYNPSLELVELADRTFSIEITGTTAPTFTSTGPLISPYLFDSYFYPIQVAYSNPDPNTTAVIRLINGSLPPGLEINEQGLIQGYATPPLLLGSPAQLTYNFTLEISSESGLSTGNFSITVRNRDLAPTSLRPPAILNTNPPSFNISPSDPNYPFYINPYGNLASYYEGNIGTFYQNNNFVFKILGYDFGGLPLTYNIVSGSLPPGLSLDSSTGYITGTFNTSSSTVSSYYFTVDVDNGIIASDIIAFTMTVVAEDPPPNSNIPVDISVNWLTNSNLGTIVNGNTSLLSVEAVNPSGLELQYSITAGSLPYNLSLNTTGEIVGKLSFESDSLVEIPYGTTTSYTFTVQAINPTYPEVNSSKEFTLNTYQQFSNETNDVYENIYIKALLSLSDRQILNTLLDDTSIIPNDYVYRNNDSNFGKATDIIYQHMYGVPSSLVSSYISAVTKNHYNRNITLGPIKTAIARNENNQVIYEVVYSEIIDNLTRIDNGQIISIDKEILYPFKINGVNKTLYPNSLPNMRKQIADSIPGQVTDGVILPLWMTSQQENGSSLGFIPAWVICYVKPYIIVDGQPVSYTQFYTLNLNRNDYLSYAQTIRDNIYENWNNTLNEINFQLDRLIIDKSLTFDYNPTTETWSTLPSGVASDDSENQYVYYPQKNILE